MLGAIGDEDAKGFVLCIVTVWAAFRLYVAVRKTFCADVTIKYS